MPRFAANLGFLFPEHAFLDRFAAARRAGFTGVEFAVPYEHPAADIRARLDEQGLACVLFNLPMGDRKAGDFGLACRPERRDEFRAGVDRALEYARVLRPERINCIAGLARPAEDRARLEATFLENLAFAHRTLASGGFELIVEPINPVDAPGFLLTRCDEAARLLAALGESPPGLQCDLYHVAMAGDDPFATLDRHRAIIRHVQFADAPGRAEPGTGALDFGALFTHLDAMGYAGWTSAEYRPTKRTEDTLHWL